MSIIEFQEEDWGNFIEIDQTQNQYSRNVSFEYSQYIVRQDVANYNKNNEITKNIKQDDYIKKDYNYYNIVYKNWEQYGSMRCFVLSTIYFANYVYESFKFK